MNKIAFIIVAWIFFCQNVFSQSMDNSKLESIIYTLSDSLSGNLGQWQFSIDSTYFICLTDEVHNRMRIISPVREISDIDEEELRKCLEANFHTALDIKYAISDGVLWSVFIHPLKELAKHQVIDAISQVYSGVKTFGTEYSSGALSFPKKPDKKSKRS